MTQIREGGVEIPAGMKLVPIEPTDEMRDAGVLDVRAEVSYEDAVDIWSAMLAAYTPTPSPEIAEQPMGEICQCCGGRRVVPDAIDMHSYPEDRPCPVCTDGSWSLATPTDPFTTARNDIAGLPGHGMSADVQVAEQRVGEVERVAHALANADTVPPDDSDEYWPHLARAAIACLITVASEAEMQARRLDVIREDGGPLTLNDKAILRETAAMLRALATPKPADPTSVAGERMREALGAVEHWLTGVVDCAMDDIVADGGITAAMVVQQEARWQRTKIARALAANAPDAAKRERGE